MDQSIEAAIRRAAGEEGIDPAFALAVAERESDGNPNAHASRSIYGLFQMSGDLRAKYGSGNSADPYTQAKAWSKFIGDTGQGLTSKIGRAPTNEELYMAHHFGERRAARMIGGQIAPSTPTSDVFTPYEMSLNPHFGKAGTVGNLTGSISADMQKREAKYGGAGGSQAVSDGTGGIDFSQFGVTADGRGGPQGQPIDVSMFGLTKADAEARAKATTVQPGDLGATRDAGTPAPLPTADNAGAIPSAPSARPGVEVDLSQINWPQPAVAWATSPAVG